MFEDENSEFTVNIARLDSDITMLKTYLDEKDISTLLGALEELKQEPESEEAMRKVIKVFNGLGILQGAVLNYATYLKVLLPQFIDSFGDSQ